MNYGEWSKSNKLDRTLTPNFVAAAKSAEPNRGEELLPRMNTDLYASMQKIFNPESDKSESGEFKIIFEFSD